MKRVLKTMPIALLTVLFVLALAFAVLTGTTVLSKTTDGVAEAADITISTVTLNDMKSGLGGFDARDNYTPVGEWTARGFYKDGGNVYMDEAYTGRICYTIPAGYKATSVTYSATFGSEISMFKLRKGENGSYYVNVVSSPVEVVDGTTNFTEDFVAGDEFRVFINSSGMLLVSDLTITIKGVALSSPVTITKGTGVKSVYLSTSNTATSGSASGTEFTNNSTVYGFAELAKGYKSKSGWNKVSGTADTEGAKYRVGSVSAGSSNFGTVSADLITYSIGYTLNGGSVGGTNPTSYNVNTNTFTLINPTKTGYTFTGWTGSNGSTPQTSVSISKGTIGNKTYTANWTPINYSIGYTLNGGTATNTTSYNIETATFTLNNPTRTGYTFAGWTGSNGSTPQTSVSINTGSTGNKTYTANWTANQYTVTLNDNGGSGGPGSVEVYFDSDFAPIASAQRPTKAGYTFAGYYDEQNADGAASPSGTLYILGTGVAYTAWDKPNDATLYAYYTKDMTVSSSGYEEDYDGNSHTITVTVTDPASDYFILYHDPETSSNTDVNPAKTNVGSYTIDFYVSKAGYTQYQGSATIVIKEVDKTALTEPLATDDSYYNNIKDDYTSIAGDLIAVIDNIKNNIRDNANVTAAQVAQAVVDLQTALSTAKVDVTKAKIDAIGSGDYSSDKALAIQDARAYYDDELTVDEQAAVTNYQDLLDAEELYGPVGEVVAEINALQTITDLQALKAAVQTARAHYEALDPNMQAVFPDDDLDDLVDFETIIPVVEKVNALGTPEDTDAFRTAVSSARADYESLSANQQAIFPDSALKVLTDDEAVVSAMNTIKALSAPADTPEFRDAVSSARTQFDALTDDQEEIFPASVKKVLEDDEAVIIVMDEINALGAPVDTDEFREDVEDARDDFDALTDDQKSIFPASVSKTLEDDEAVVDVMDKVNALKDVADPKDYKQEVEAAGDAYDALSADQKAIFPSGVYDTLEDYEAIVPIVEGINAIGTPVDTQAFRDAVSESRADYTALNGDQKAIFPDSVLNVLADDEAIIPVMDAIDALSAPADTSAFRTDVEDTRADFDALSADQKAIFPADVLKTLEDDEAVIDVMDTINALGAPADTDAFREDVEDARDDFDALTNDQKAIFPASVSKTLEDDEAVVDVMDTINALKDVADPKDYKQEVEDAGDAYDALSADQKALFPSDVLDTLEDYEAIVPIVEGINAIGTPVNTQDFRDKSAQADSDFNALSPERQALVPESVKKVLEDDKAIIPVMDAIDALSAPADTDAFREDVEDARDDFDALTDDQKAIFPASVSKTLEDDEAVIDVMDEIKALGDFEYTPGFEDKLDEARGNFDALSDDQKAIFPSSVQDTLVNDEKAYDAIAKIEAIGKPVANDDATREKADVARDAYDALTPEQLALIDPDFIEDLEDAEDVIDFMDKVNAIGTPEDTQSFRDKVADATNVCDNELTPNQLALVPEDVIKALTDDEALVPVMDAIGSIGNPANTDSFREASGDARDVYAALTDDQKAIFPADVLKTLEDDESVIEVLDVIDAIGNVEYSEGSEARIDAAREAYDALSADQKAKFPSSDLKTLVDDEKAYEAMDVVYNIGEIENNAETKERIAAARATYDALTPDQKALVAPSFVKNLEDSEAVYDAIEQINAIGEIGYDDQSEEAIRAAREAYDGLSEDQKALMPQETVNALEADEQTFATKSDNAKKLYIALLVVFAIALCASICFLCFQFIKRKNGKKQEKVMSSVLMVPVILAASYYVSAPFIAIYILAGLLVASIVANIAIAASNKKKKEASKAQKAEQKANKQADEPHDDAKNYVCIADDSEPTYDLRHDVEPEPEQPAEEPVEEPAEEPVEEPVEEAEEEVAADSADEDESVAEEELEQEEEPKEEPAPVEDVKKEEPITLKQSMSVAKHSVHSMKWNKKAIANDLRDRHAGEVEINERENYTSTGLPLADTHYAVDGKTRKCFIYVYETEGAPMLLINSDADLAEELNERHGNVHRSAFPKSKDLWFSLPLDDSYSQEEVQSILDRCHAYALGRDEKEFSLKESLALAKNVKSAHSQSKKSICEYLEAKYGDQVELNTRDNYTSTGLPLADTHYVKGEDGKSRCFVYVYETEGSMMLLTRSNYDFAKALKENHENVHRSAFPKAKEPWNMVLLDDSFSDEEVHELLDKLVALNK